MVCSSPCRPVRLRFGRTGPRTAANNAPFPITQSSREESRCARESPRSRLVGLLAAAAVVGAATLGPGNGTASSHREAPLIAEDPSADLTDVYAFRSPDRPNTVTILANVIPGEDPAAGPNWYTFSPNARYNLKLDTNGRRARRRHIPVPVPHEDRAVLPRRHRPAVHGDADRRREGDRRRTRHDAAEQHRPALHAELPRARHEVDRLVRRRRLQGVRRPARRPVLRRHRGDLRPRRHPQGHRQHGRRQGLLRRLRRAHVRRAGPDRGPAGEERHDRCLGVGRPAEGHDPRRRQTRNSGAWVQVNRLGNPLVNEVVIPTGLKDRWNARRAVAGGAATASTTRRPSWRQSSTSCTSWRAGDGPRRPRRGPAHRRAEAQLHRPEARRPAPPQPGDPGDASPNRLGVLAGDNQGWPNGRRLGDDVVDIAEQAVAGFLKGKKVPLGDGVDGDDRKLLGPSRTSRTRRAASTTRRASSSPRAGAGHARPPASTAANR